MGTCARCKAPIRWAKSAASGLLIALDAEPVPDGTYLLAGGTVFVLGLLTQRTIETGKLRYQSHDLTCPHAGRKEPHDA